MLDVMIYKNDFGFWKKVTDSGEIPANYETYEDAVYSLPKEYWCYFI